MSFPNNLDFIEAAGQKIVDDFGDRHDPEILRDVSFYVLASATPEIHPLDVMKTGVNLIVEDAHAATRAAKMADSLLSDEDLCRRITIAKQAI